MTTWSLSQLLSGLHEDIQQRLQISRSSFGHPGTKGDASETVWLKLLQTYLPQRYQAATAHVVDSEGAFSDQIDVVVFDRQYSPFIFSFEGQTIIPAESVYAVFEAKQTANAELARGCRCARCAAARIAADICLSIRTSRRSAVGRTARAVREMEERAQAFHAMGQVRRLGARVCRTRP